MLLSNLLSILSCLLKQTKKDNELRTKENELFKSERELSKALVQANSSLDDCQSTLTLAENDLGFKIQVAIKATKKVEREHYQSVINDVKIKSKKKQLIDDGVISELKDKSIELSVKSIVSSIILDMSTIKSYSNTICLTILLQ